MSILLSPSELFFHKINLFYLSPTKNITVKNCSDDNNTISISAPDGIFIKKSTDVYYDYKYNGSIGANETITFNVIFNPYSVVKYNTENDFILVTIGTEIGKIYINAASVQSILLSNSDIYFGDEKEGSTSGQFIDITIKNISPTKDLFIAPIVLSDFVGKIKTASDFANTIPGFHLSSGDSEILSFKTHLNDKSYILNNITISYFLCGYGDKFIRDINGNPILDISNEYIYEI